MKDALQKIATRKIVLYDGDCGFCNRSVQFVLKADKSETIHFAAIQSDFVQQLFQENNWDAPDLSTFYFVENGALFQKSTGALKLTKYFKWPQKALALGWMVPRFIRDAIYDSIAKRRQRLAKGFCVLPSPEEHARFIN